MTPEANPRKRRAARERTGKQAVKRSGKQATPKVRPQPVADAVAEREQRLRELTEQCLELLDQLATTRQQTTEIVAQRDELAATRDQVSRDRITWLERILVDMEATTKHFAAEDLGDLAERSLAGQEGAGDEADLDRRFERLGERIGVEHQIKSALSNVLDRLRGQIGDQGEILAERDRLEQDQEESGRQLHDAKSRAHAADELGRGLRAELDALHEAEAGARNQLADLAAKTGAAEEALRAVRRDLERERSDRSSERMTAHQDLDKARANLAREQSARVAAESALADLRALLQLSPDVPTEAVFNRLRELRGTLVDRDRWVASLLDELSRRRLKLTRRPLSDEERRFLEGRNRGEET